MKRRGGKGEEGRGKEKREESPTKSLAWSQSQYCVFHRALYVVVVKFNVFRFYRLFCRYWLRVFFLRLPWIYRCSPSTCCSPFSWTSPASSTRSSHSTGRSERLAHIACRSGSGCCLSSIYRGCYWCVDRRTLNRLNRYQIYHQKYRYQACAQRVHSIAKNYWRHLANVDEARWYDLCKIPITIVML